jgi:RimJ/RimL family protein N-acetyltransferase/CheY-like chemotaxis protein
MTIDTERLHLRPFRDEDLDAYAEMCADAEVMRYVRGTPLDRADAWREMAMFVGHWQLRGFGIWAVEERATGALVGRIGLYYPEGWPDRELGWALLKRYWGRGYATEGCRAALDHAFDVLGWPRVISLIHPDNLGLPEALEDVREELRGDALAGVADEDLDVRVDPLEAHLHPPAARRELDRVRHEIPRDLLQAIRVARDRDVPDVLVSDLGMPGTDGLALIRRVRESINPQVQSIPALALTAYARSEDRITALANGFQMHVAKPADPTELVVAVSSLARRAGTRAS